MVLITPPGLGRGTTAPTPSGAVIVIDTLGLIVYRNDTPEINEGVKTIWFVVHFLMAEGGALIEVSENERLPFWFLLQPVVGQKPEPFKYHTEFSIAS